MIDKTKNTPKLIWFDNRLARQIDKAVAKADTDATKWIRQACREKLQRDIAIAAAQTAGQEQGK